MTYIMKKIEYGFQQLSLLLVKVLENSYLWNYFVILYLLTS